MSHLADTSAVWRLSRGQLGSPWPDRTARGLVALRRQVPLHLHDLRPGVFERGYPAEGLAEHGEEGLVVPAGSKAGHQLGLDGRAPGWNAERLTGREAAEALPVHGRAHEGIDPRGGDIIVPGGMFTYRVVVRSERVHVVQITCPGC
ncbi:hypothetical protein ABZX30_02000 [Streptomyces sp. NPDC004542]|uniref:hypothetical protein n=1 Tax=Streptomyces sp. NPDC004542 TaxID=3154281 RepID=UPI0033AB71D1